MLMTDDTGWNDFGAYSGGGGGLGHPTPNIDRIAKEGATFTSWYGQASCTAGVVELLFPRGDAASFLFGFNAKNQITGVSLLSMAGD